MPKPKELSEKPSPLNKPVEAQPADMPMWLAVGKEQGKKLSIGDSITAVVRGEIAGIRERRNIDGDTAGIEVELKTHKVLEVDSNTADVALRQMTA
jgi:hypothetical protein